VGWSGKIKFEVKPLVPLSSGLAEPVMELQTSRGPVVDLDAESSIRISQALYQPRREGFSSFLALPCNIRATESCLMFATGLIGFSCIVGPQGSGKSHLLQCVQRTYRMESGYDLRTYNLPDLLKIDPLFDSPRPLIIDMAEIAFRTPRLKHRLRLVLERRVRTGKPTLIAFEGSKVSRPIRGLLAYSRNWNTVELGEPSPQERLLLLRHLAQSLEMEISESILRLMALKLPGTGHALVGGLQRLRVMHRRWMGPEREPRAAGVLAHDLTGGDGWDVRDHVMELLELPAFRSAFPREADRTAFAAYYLRDVMSLPEEDVAGVLHLRDGQVHRFAKEVESGKIVSDHVKLRDSLTRAFFFPFESV